MRICVMANQFPVVSQTFVVHHVAGLLRRGHEVVVVPVTPRRSADDLATEEFEAVVRATEATPAPSGSALARFAAYASFGARGVARGAGALRFAAGDAGFAVKRFGPRLLCATRVADAGPIDVVHAHFGPVGVVATALRDAGVFRAPIVCSFHGYDANVIAEQHPGCYDAMPGRIEAVTAGTGFMKDVVVGLGFPARDVTVWPQGVDTERFVPRSDRSGSRGFHVLSVARLVDFKGIDIALRAVAKARPHIDGLRYTIIGDGERRIALESLAEELSIADITDFRGAQPHDEVEASFADADVFVLTGRVDAEGQKEGQGVAPLEASASGLPVIASRAGGLSEVVIDGETGVLVDPEDVDAAADALVALAGDPSRRAALGSAGRAHVQAAFSRDHSIDVIERVYRDVIARATRRPPRP